MSPVPEKKPALDTAKSVLLCEDDPGFALSILDAMRRVGNDWRVAHCESGKAAQDQFLAHGGKFDLALVDIGLPDISGIDLMAWLHERAPDMPIMVISAMTAENILLQSIRAGARGYIVKSSSRSALTQAIAEVAQGDYPISPSLARHLFRMASEVPVSENDTPSELTKKEVEILSHFSIGLSYEATAARMGISISTVRYHVGNLYRKLEVHTQLQAVQKARAKGWL